MDLSSWLSPLSCSRDYQHFSLLMLTCFKTEHFPANVWARELCRPGLKQWVFQNLNVVEGAILMSQANLLSTYYVLGARMGEYGNAFLLWCLPPLDSVPWAEVVKSKPMVGLRWLRPQLSTTC